MRERPFPSAELTKPTGPRSKPRMMQTPSPGRQPSSMLVTDVGLSP
jgi:hypothetical protein